MPHADDIHTCAIAVRTTARMAAFIPEATPPLVKTAMRMLNGIGQLLAR